MPNLFDPYELNSGGFINYIQDLPFAILPDIHNIQPKSTFTENYSRNNNSIIVYRLLNANEDVIAAIRLILVEFCGQKFYSVNKVFVDAYYRGRGYGTYLYENAIRNSAFSILSDMNLTRPGSFNIWNRLHKQSEYGVSCINTNNCAEVKYDENKETYFWGFDLDMMEELKDPENIELLITQSPKHFELYDFLRSNSKSITDKKHIRLVFR